jgi:hypothetical protein
MDTVIKFFAYFSLLMMTSCSEDNRFLTLKDTDSIAKEMQTADKDTLVIFDVTDVLLEPSRMLFRTKNSNQLSKILQEFSSRASKKEKEDIFGLIVQQVFIPIDKRLVGILFDLQGKMVNILALSDVLAGEYGEIEYIKDILVAQLNILDYHFEESWRDTKNADFCTEKGQNISFKDGVVFTRTPVSESPKENSVVAFLKYAHLHPRKIIFVSSNQENLKSMEAAIKSSSAINFVGIEYTASRDRDMKPIDEEHAKLQFQILEKEHRLLSDEETQKMLSKSSKKK